MKESARGEEVVEIRWHRVSKNKESSQTSPVKLCVFFALWGGKTFTAKLRKFWVEPCWLFKTPTAKPVKCAGQAKCESAGFFKWILMRENSTMVWTVSLPVRWLYLGWSFLAQVQPKKRHDKLTSMNKSPICEWSSFFAFYNTRLRIRET